MLEALVDMLLAAEVVLAPVWVGAAIVRPPARLGIRLARTLVGPALAGAALLVLALVVGGETAVGMLRAQGVLLGFAIVLAGWAACLERIAGPRATQMATVLAGWLLVGTIFLAGPLVQLVGEKAALARAAVYVNPLVVAEHAVGIDWLHRGLTYRWSPLAESYAIYYASGLAWWKTCLGYLFVGSALLVFGRAGLGRRRPADGGRETADTPTL